MCLEKRTLFSKRCFAVVVFFFGQQAVLALAQPEVVDRAEVLVIGPLKISAYCVAKNFDQFRSLPDRTNRPVSPSEARLWLNQFMDRQVIVAHALAQGYGEREFVRRELARMERHMLTSRRGPYYQQIFSAYRERFSDHDLIRDKDPRIYQMQIARVPKSAPIAAELSLAEGPVPGDPQLFARLQQSGEGEVFQGWLSRPFMPFAEIGSSLELAQTGQWLRTITPDSVLVYRVLAVGLSSLPGHSPAPADPVVQPADEFERRVELEHQQEIIERARWRFDWAGAEKMIALFGQLRPDPAFPLGPEIRDPVQDIELGDYWQGSTRHAIRGADYVEYYNRQFVRRLPRRKLDVYQDIRSFVVELQDYHDACNDRILLQPKFSEDRENYRNNLILGEFEKDHPGESPLGEMSPTERRTQLARKLQSANPFTIEDHIPYGRFGLPEGGMVAAP